MDSGIYCLGWGKSKHFYIGKSDNIPKRWKQHKRSFETGKHAVKMQECYDREGPPTYSVFLTCHSDHVDLYESMIIRHNLGPLCLNGALPKEVPLADQEILLEAGDYIEMSTAQHIKLIEDTKANLTSKTEELEALKNLGIKMPADWQSEIDTLIEVVKIQRKELQRLKNLSLWDRIFNFK
jgi:hypothetical protein